MIHTRPAALSLLAAAVLTPLSLFAKTSLPDGLESTVLAGPDITPCPACLSAAPTGELFVGVDLNGSLGKSPGKGRIVRLVDTDADGVADAHTVFAQIDNPRGLISVGTKLHVLHSVIPADTGKLEALHLSVLEDKDWNGVADGPPRILISDISPPKHNQRRGADHTTNGIRMGIDDWIYIAVGDFGIHGAKGTDGTELTMLGGGVVRLRPDGSELEVYTHGLRNIYDIAIDPLMNIFTRGNTNDGGGWNVRFIHHIQSGEYGYPVLFKHFTDEIIPALADLGGGSGTGSMFFQEPGWPDKYNDVPMMCDWGRNKLFIHRVTPDEPTFTQASEDFIKLQQITDVDSDASGRLYAGAWAGAGFKGNPDKGWVERIVPQGWEYKPFTAPAKLDDKALVALLHTASASARLAASQELLKRPAAAVALGRLGDASVANDLLALANPPDEEKPIAAPPAFQTKVFKGHKTRKVEIDVKGWEEIYLVVRDGGDGSGEDHGTWFDPVFVGADGRDVKLSTLKWESAKGGWGKTGFGISASGAPLKDGTGKAQPDGLGTHANSRIVFAVPKGAVQFKARVGIAATSKAKGKIQFVVARTDPGTVEGKVPEGPHATPNSPVVLPHIAVKALVDLHAVDACVDAVGGPHSRGALWALRKMHDTRAVDDLIAKYASTSADKARADIKTRKELEISMMPPGLANALSIEEFASLLAYLESMKG